ncbi:hypothetical protein [Limosilactobacillus sp.]
MTKAGCVRRARELGSNGIVVGRPITRVPVAAYQQIQQAFLAD